MQFHLLLDNRTDEYRALSEVLTELGHELCSSGLPVSLEKCQKGVRVFGTEGAVTLQYADRTALLRGAGLLCRHAGTKFDVTQTPAYDTLGAMPDVSRNAVLSVEGVKRLCRYTALMGFNAMLLYTEDVYEVEGEPFFGHMRGRYSAAELREMDDYAALLGIELIPGIQTLAHLAPIFRWPAYKPMRDVDDILNVSHERAYEFIERMIASVSKNLRSRRINIGMDEAFLLGRGNYLTQNGYRSARDIMLEHLQKVVEICKKYGQQPRMWSDMFFRMATPDHTYRNPVCNMTEEILSIVPKEVTLVYWDYYSVDKARYDFQMENHLKFRNPIAFAGGDSGWYSIVPLNVYSVAAARPALQCAREHGIREVYATMWRSTGLAASFFSVLPTLVLYGEDCWCSDTGDENLRGAMAALGCSYDAFMAMEQIENHPGREHNFGAVRIMAAKHMFWQDVLSGRYDAHIPQGEGAHFAACRDMLREVRKEGEGRFGYVFDLLEAYCHALELKAECGIGLKKAYDAKDTAKLTQFRDSILPELLRRTESFYEVYRIHWHTENRPSGWDTQDIRFGALLLRLKTAIRRVDEYLTGKIETIEELDCDRLPMTPPHPTVGIFQRDEEWRDIVTPGIL